MIMSSVRKKWNVKLTISDRYVGQEEKIIGQLWEYAIPGKTPDKDEIDHYHFAPKHVPEFEGIGLFSDGHDDKQSLLENIKLMYKRKLKIYGLVPDRAKLLFSLLPVEQVF